MLVAESACCWVFQKVDLSVMNMAAKKAATLDLLFFDVLG